MAEEVTIVIKGDNKASKPIGDASKSVQDLGQESQKTSQSVGGMNTGLQGAQGAAGGLSPAMMAAGAAVAGVAAAAVAAAAAVGALISVARAGIDAFAEQDEVNRGLEQSLRGVGFAGASLQESIAGIDASIAGLAKSTMFGDEELKKMASTFINVSGQAGITEDQMRLIADMAQGMGKSTEEAAKLMARAMKGDLPESLAESTSLTKAQIAELKQIPDASDRARAATDLLAQTFGGASENLNGYFRSMKNLEDAKGDFLQKIGQVITESGAFEPVIDGITAALNGMEAGIGENQDAISAWLIDAVAASVDLLATMIRTLEFLSPALAYVAIGVENLGRSFSTVKLASQAVIDLFIALQSQVIGRLLQAISKLLDGLSAVASIASDDMAVSIKTAANGVREFSQLSLGVSSAAFDGMVDKTKQIGANIVDSVVALTEIPERSRTIGTALGAAASATERIRDNIRAAKDDIGKVSDEADARPSGAAAAAEEVAVEETPAVKAAKAEQKAIADTAAEDERRNAIATARLALLREEDVLVRANLEATIKELELEGRKLTDLEREFELASINFELEKTRADFERETNEARMAALEAERVAKDAAIKQEKERLAATYAANTETIRGLDQAIPGLGQLAAGLRTVAEQQRLNADASEAAMSALGGLTSLGGQLAGMITSDRKKAAKVEAAFHAAAAIGAFAAWAASSFTLANYGVAAAQHGVAAVKFGMVAGSGGSSQTPSRGGGGGGGGGAGMLARDRAATSTQQAKPADIVINVDMGSSTNLRSAVDTGREIGQSVADAARNEFRL